MEVQPYLNFDGRCEEALQFYGKAVGAEVLGILRMKEAPGGPDPTMVPAGCEEKVMHASFRVGGTVLMASDTRCQGAPTFHGISLTFVAADAGEAGRCFAALSDGGQVQMPLAETFFSPCFGVLVDRFGVSWNIYVPVDAAD